MRPCTVLSIALALLASPGVNWAQNYLKVGSGSGAPGSDVTLKITVTSSQAIAGASFTVNFDKSRLQIASTAVGADAASMTPVGIEVRNANGDGSLEVSLVDFTFSNPVAAGAVKEIYLITFTIAARASGEVPVKLTGVSLSDVSAGDIPISVIDGKVYISGTAPDPGSQDELEKNYLYILPVAGTAGQSATAKVGINTLSEIAGASFTIVFNPSLIRLTSVEKTG